MTKYYGYNYDSVFVGLPLEADTATVVKPEEPPTTVAKAGAEYLSIRDLNGLAEAIEDIARRVKALELNNLANAIEDIASRVEALEKELAAAKKNEADARLALDLMNQQLGKEHERAEAEKRRADEAERKANELEKAAEIVAADHMTSPDVTVVDALKAKAEAYRRQKEVEELKQRLFRDFMESMRARERMMIVGPKVEETIRKVVSKEKPPRSERPKLGRDEVEAKHRGANPKKWSV